MTYPSGPPQQDPRYQPWPQQAQQPYSQQTYPPQEPYAPRGQMPPGRPHRKSWPRRHKILTGLLGFTGFWVVVIVAVAATSGANHTVTTGQAGSTSSASKAAATGTARVGSAITLTGNSSGEQMAVTVIRVFRHPQPATGLDGPQQGDRLYAVQFRLADTGSAAYSDSPSNGAAVVDSAGQSYQSSLSNVAECQSFPAAENIAGGSSGLGCVVFEVPSAARIVSVQFTLDSGMGPQTGQWDVRS